MSDYKKQRQRLIDQITAGTFESDTEKRLAKRDANLRKQQAEAKTQEEEIAPVKRTWFKKGAFEDGYNFGDVTKTILGTTTDLTQDLGAGILGIAEKTVDTGAYLLGGGAKLIGQDNFSNKMEKFIEKDLIDEEKISTRVANYTPTGIVNNILTGNIAPYSPKNIFDEDKTATGSFEENSLLGEKSDSLVQSAGQLAGTFGLQFVGVPWWLTTGVASFGGEVEQAFKKDATYGEAGASGLISAGAEILTEKISGGISFGGKTLDEGAKKLVSNIIANKTAQNLTKFGMDAVGEGFEEVLTEVINNVGKKLTYEDEETWKDILASEEAMDAYLESFIGGAVLGGVINTPRAIDSVRNGKDYDTGLIAEQQAQELQQVRAEKEAELQQAEDIRVQQIIQEEIQVIDEELSSIQQATDLKQRNFTYEANETDSEYKKAVYESAKQVNMNDTEASHKLADAVAKISEERKTTYLFVDNQSLEAMGHKIEGKTINGLVDEDGSVLLNIESEKLVNRVLGHETTHLLEGTKEYDELRTIAIEFAKTTGDYQARLYSLNSLYEGRNADIEAELTADIVGDYLFTNEQFVKELSVQKPTIFQKIKELISDLVVKFKGTKQEKQLRELQRKFENAYRNTDSKVSETSKNVIDVDNQGRKLTDEQRSYFKDSKVRDKDGNLLAVYHGTRGDFNVFETKRTGQNYEGGYSSLGRGSYFTSDIDTAKKFGEDSVNEGDLNIKETYINIKNPFYADEMTRNDSKVLEEIKEKYDIKEAEMYDGYNMIRILRSLGVDSTAVLQEYGYDGIIAEDEYVVFDSNQVKNVDNTKPTESKDIRYSLTDNQGKKLSKEQQEYFKDSKVRDENGNLLTMYHGTKDNFTIFEHIKGKYDTGFAGKGFYFTSGHKTAQNYSNWKKGNNDYTPKVMSVYLNIKNPLIVDDLYGGMKVAISKKLNVDIDTYNVMKITQEESEKITNALIKQGYDGVMYEFDGETYAMAINPEQIKNVDNKKPTTNPDIRYSLSEEQEIPLNERLSGDDLLNAEDLIYEIEDIAEVSPNGYVTLYHRTSQENANEIYKTGKMSAKEDGVFFSTKNADSQAIGFGDSVVKVKVPVEKLVLDDLFSDEAHLKIPLKNKNEVLDVSQYLVRDKMSLSNKGEQDIAPTGDFDISSEDIKLQIQEAIAPMQEIVTDLVEQMKNIAPASEPVQEVAPVQTEINEKGVQMGIGDQVRTFNNSTYEVTDFFKTDDGVVRARLRDSKGYETSIGINSIAENLSDPTKNNVSTRIENDSLQNSEAVETQNAEAFDNIGDVPPSFEDAFDEAFSDLTADDFEHKTTVESPLQDRNIEDVGNRKVKAYQYENPEVRPYFQAEAENMLYDLENTIKGEKIAIKDEAGYITDWAGVSRQTTESIAYLKDTWGYSYAEIEKGLNDIIKDEGSENNAVAKRIEFLLDERLREGYTMVDGTPIPPNEDYIKFLEEKQITEYNSQNIDSLAVDENVPVEAPLSDRAKQVIEALRQDELATAPVKTNENAQISNETQEVIKDVAPVENVPQNPNTEAVEGKQRKWATTSTESESIRDEIQLSDLDVEKISYIPITNKSTLSKVNTKINSLGYDKALSSFNSFLESGKRVTAEDITLGERLMQEALQRGDKETAINLLQDVTILGTELGQATQALSIIQRMTPAGQLKMLEKTINRAKAKGNKSFENVELTKEMKKKVLDTFKDGTFDQNELNKAVDEVKQELADQIQATGLDKVNAWRYLAMLGNPKTHIRNLVSNIAMYGTTEVKNALARTIESVAPVKERTKTWKSSSKQITDFAEQTATEMKDIISGDNKYNDETGIKNLARTFETEILEKAYNFNNDLLQKEDWWFSGARFKSALSEFLTANNINTMEDIQNNPELVEKAKTYALEQSRIATFRQASYLANKIREIENKNVATNIAVGSIIPFKKTPINVAKTGLAYSPLGFAKTLTYDIAKVKKGDMDASTLVDHLAQNTVGTALTLAGYMLAMSGFLGGAGGDDEEAKYDYQLGKQSYAINIDGQSYSLSWLSPVAMPLFVGANMFEQLVEGKEWNGDVVVETLAQTLDPLNEMSFLSSLTDVLSSYETGTQKFAGMFESMAQNYATQFVPTVSSQVAGTIDDTKRSTKVASDSGFKFVDETINKLIYKIPVLRQTLEPSTDIWGNEVKQSENVLLRAYENFISPYARKESTATEIDENIKEVFSATGDNGVIPNVPRNTIKFDNETYKMTAKEYTTYKQTYGQTANDLLEDLFRTTTYRTAGAEEKADMINDVYDYASDIAKKEQLVKDGVNYTNATEDGVKVYKENLIKKAIEHDMLVDEYKLYEENPEKYQFLQDNNISFEEYDRNKEEYNYAFKNPNKYAVAKAITDYPTYTEYSKAIYDLKADKDSDGDSISGSRREKVISYVNSLDLSIPQKAMLIRTEYSTFTEYNNEIVDYVVGLDVDYEEKVKILEGLDMTIDEDGYVYWK